MESQPPRFPPEYFRRQDESADPSFYLYPRLVVHIDDASVEAVRAYLAEVLPPRGTVLDLMSSRRSHLPHGYNGQVVGLGLNPEELADNPQLDERIIHDLNADPVLPIEADRFDAAVVTVSIQYMTRPIETFREVRRLLSPGGTFHVIFSDRMFSTKAVAIWRSLSEPRRRADLIDAYFDEAGGWALPEFLDRSPQYADPVYVVRAMKEG